jgi:hypothetical protein
LTTSNAPFYGKNVGPSRGGIQPSQLRFELLEMVAFFAIVKDIFYSGMVEECKFLDLV